MSNVSISVSSRSGSNAKEVIMNWGDMESRTERRLESLKMLISRRLFEKHALNRLSKRSCSSWHLGIVLFNRIFRDVRNSSLAPAKKSAARPISLVSI